MQTAERVHSYDMGLVDDIRNRMGATYTEALHALEEGQGDLLRALAIIEETRTAARAGETDLIERIFRIADEGIQAVRVSVGDKFQREMRIGMGSVGSLLAALVVGFFNEIRLEAVKGEPEPETMEAGS